MLQQEAEIINKLGLHARASAKFTQMASTRGSKILIETDGPDESEAMKALCALINDRFGEGE